MATYQMIHIAHPPVETHGLRVPRRNCRRQGRWNWDLCCPSMRKSFECDFPATRGAAIARSAGLRIGDRLIGWTEGPRPRLIHNVGVYSQAAYPALENLHRTEGLWAAPSRRLRPARAAEHDPL